ncbi:hypothetical protein AVEN_82487-1 [Araneus ventricosus]|uniref:Uncharacterized protein n=1 Tax=Araneus ventricosus TaxID=182803 RepID=A0A4Y2RPZ5_ARAVE|nr:hypothetical protein AVEN_82487-1 [Araneus ventricosus]
MENDDDTDTSQSLSNFIREWNQCPSRGICAPRRRKCLYPFTQRAIQLIDNYYSATDSENTTFGQFYTGKGCQAMCHINAFMEIIVRSCSVKGKHHPSILHFPSPYFDENNSVQRMSKTAKGFRVRIYRIKIWRKFDTHFITLSPVQQIVPPLGKTLPPLPTSISPVNTGNFLKPFIHK